jgi:putative sigma-54 modulation protein
MKVDIQSIHFDVDKKLETRINMKVSKLDTFHDSILGANVNLRLDKSNTRDNKVAEMKILINGNELFSKRQSNSFEDAFDQTYEAIKGQLIKHKEKIRH